MSIYLIPTSLNFQDTEKGDHIIKRLKNKYLLSTFGNKKIFQVISFFHTFFAFIPSTAF